DRRGPRPRRPRPRSRAGRRSAAATSPARASPTPRTTSGSYVIGRRRSPAAPPYELDAQQPEDEAADVCEEGDPASRLRVRERVVALPELEPCPEPEKDDRRHLDRDEEEQQREHPRSGQEQEVGAEHTGNGAAGADIRDARVQLRGPVERDE